MAPIQRFSKLALMVQYRNSNISHTVNIKANSKVAFATFMIVAPLKGVLIRWGLLRRFSLLALVPRCCRLVSEPPNPLLPQLHVMRSRGRTLCERLPKLAERLERMECNRFSPY